VTHESTQGFAQDARVFDRIAAANPRKWMASAKPDTNTLTLTVRLQDVYGKQTVYPVCHVAKTFAALTGCKTLTSAALTHIQSLGYTIVPQQRTL
jgi:hypothetical protein